LSTGLLSTLGELLLPSEPILMEWKKEADDRFFADILLTPLEATRIRLVSDRNVCPHPVCRSWALIVVRQRPSIRIHQDVDYRRYRSDVRWIYPHFGQTNSIRHRSIYSERTMYRSDLQANVPRDQSQPWTRPEPEYNTRIRYSGRFRRGNPKSCKFHFSSPFHLFHVILIFSLRIHFYHRSTRVMDLEDLWYRD